MSYVEPGIAGSSGNVRSR